MIVSKRPIVALDVDEVCADFVGQVLGIVWEITGRLRSRQEIHLWDISTSLGLTEDESKAMWARVGERGLCARLEPVAGAVEGVKLLREFADVRAVTSPFKSETWAHEREVWLTSKLGFDREHVVQTPGKDIVFAHAFVDDRVQTLRAWRDCWPGSHPILFSAPWNEREGWDGHVVHDWNEIVKLIRTLVAR